jgi:hypothetical protein
MKQYTLLEASIKLGVCKTAVYLKVIEKKLGERIMRGKVETILLSEKEVESLTFRAKNKKRYTRNLQSK